MKTLRSLTLRSRMIIGAVAAVIIPFFVAGAVIYVQLSQSLMSISKEKSVHFAEDISDFVGAALLQQIKLASSIAADPDIVSAGKTEDYRVAQQELASILHRIGDDIFTIFLTDRAGIDRADPRFPQQIGLDLSDREYFRKAQQGLANVTEPFMPRGDAEPEKPLMIVCVPIQDGNEFLGIVAVAFHTDFLAGIIYREKNDHGGSASLITKEGLFLVHPRKELILNFNLFDYPGTENLKQLAQGSENGATSFFLDGTERIAGVAEVGLTGWKVIYSQTKKEIMAPVNSVLSVIFFSGTLFLAVTISIIVIYFSRISTPIQKMMDMMRQVTHLSNEMILQIGTDRKIIYANPAFEKITGLRSEAVLGTEPEWTNTKTPPEIIWSRLETGTPWSGRVTLHDSGTDSITLDVMVVPLRNRRGVIEGYLEIGRDISKEVMFEKRLIQAQKLEAIGTLAGGIAHDFNNILSGIFGYAELLLMTGKSDPEAEKSIRSIIQASERARDLVTQILTFSRQTDVALKPVAPKYVLKEASKLLRASIPAPIDIQLQLNSDATILADPTQLHQIIMNLMTNSVHAMGKKSGTIRMQLNDFQVDEEFARTHPGIETGNHILLRVSDTGQGMEPEVVEQIFEPFFTTKPFGEGTGLGLSVVHGIVKKFNGIITVYSEAGKGTTFNIIIPCTDIEVSGQNRREIAIQKGTERLAIIDDEAAIVTTMASILTNLGYRVVPFTDSTEAIRTLKKNPGDFDLVITDYSMPKVTGLDIARSLVREGIDIPVILTSGFWGKEMEQVAVEAGITELVAKPINAYQLASAIRRAL